MEFEQLLENLRSEGDCEIDLDFAVDLSKARRHRLTAPGSDGGLLALSKAVEDGVRNVRVDGNDHTCRLSYNDQSVLLYRGAFSQLLRRGALAPVNLWVNGQRLVSGVSQPLVRLPLTPRGHIQGGYVDILRKAQQGQVELVDRGVSFRLGSIFGAVRVVARVAPQKGAPWPSRLVFDHCLKSLLGELLRDVQDLYRNYRTTIYARESSQSQLR